MRDDDLPISRSRVIPGSALEVRTARSGGPGGQHVNTTESKVQLFLDVAAIAWLDAGARTRLYALAGRSVDSEGRIHVQSQENRDQLRNLEEARAKLAELVRRALVVPKKRIATKPSRGSKMRRLDSKKRTSEKKAGRGRVREE